MHNESLTGAERTRLTHLEHQIKTYREQERVSVFEAGKALIEIRESKLYREDGTFEQYCRARWGWSARHAYRVCEATEVRDGQLLLAESSDEEVAIPSTETQARKLKKANVTQCRNSKTSTTNNKPILSKPMSAKLDVSEPIEYAKPPALPMDLRILLATMERELDGILHRGDIPYDPYRILCHIASEVKQARQLLQGVLPGMEEHVSKPKFKRPTLDEVQLFCSKSGICPRDAEWFWNKMEGSGWKNGGKPVADWQRTLTAWKLAGHLPSQKTINSNGAVVPKEKSLAQKQIERLQAEVERL